jgi:hypothetical protein
MDARVTHPRSLGPARAACGVWPRLVFAALLVTVSLAFAPSSAAGAACPSADTSYLGNCGPGFAMPNWTDAGGWTDPSKYSTIQLADVNGDGSDELIGRNDAGLEIYWFDKTYGQWRPQVDADGNRQVLADFASPAPPQESSACSVRNAWYYSTIQAADIDGRAGEEILARFCDGMRVFQYAPPSTAKEIDGGTWTRIGNKGPFPDSDNYGNPKLYSTIHVAAVSRPPRATGNVAVLFARQDTSVGQPSLAIYTWQRGAWTRLPDPSSSEGYVSGFSLSECGTPECYLTLQAAYLSAGDASSTALPFRLNDIMGRNWYGVAGFELNFFSGWTRLSGSGDNTSQTAGPFSDKPGGPDCPFSATGTKLPGSSDCVGSSPAYYETMQGADIDGVAGDELMARAVDGLRVYKWMPPGAGSTSGSFVRLATLGSPVAGSLPGKGASIFPGQWGSIRTADIDGNGKREVLALDGTALSAWTYDGGANTWSQMPASPQLGLAEDPWSHHPEYYSTIRTGDVDGDGRDDVVARGPSGIRTWFYDRRGTGGWERYLADGYDAFADGGPQNAFAALTTLAKNTGVIPRTATSVRDVWSKENAPQPSDLTTLKDGLVSIANCSNPVPGNPPSYGACTPPSGSSGFSALQWRDVVNQMLAENYAASQVVAFFSELDQMRAKLFIAENAELPAIGQDLGLQAGAATTAKYNFAQLFSSIFGILGTFSSFANPLLGATLNAESYVLSAVPQSSSTATSSFQTDYAGLQDQFAKMVTEIDKALAVQSQEVRQDAGLLLLVSQLRSSGAWDLDAIGIESAANQGFATWVYRTLIPELYDRYQVTNCYDNYGSEGKCSSAVTKGTGVVGGGQSFTALGPNYVNDSYPCWDDFFDPNVCSYTKLPDDLVNRIWGPLSSDCSYQTGSSQTAWTFGCSAGVDSKSSIVENSWGFGHHSGDFTVYYEADCPPSGATKCAGDDASAAAPQLGSGPPIRLGRQRKHGARRAVRARADLRAKTVIPRMRLAGATVRLGRLLFERRGLGELTRARGRRASRSLRLRRASSGRFTAASKGRPRVRIVLRRLPGRGRGRVALRLQMGAAAFDTPRACHALRASTAIDTPPVERETRHWISNARTRRHRILLRHRVRCRRDSRGNIHRLEHVRPRRQQLRRGLAVTVQGPRSVQPGTTVRYVARVHNRRRGKRRLLSSLWDVTLFDRSRSTRIHELRRGRSRKLVLTYRVPRSARRRICVEAGATAPGARGMHAQACSRVGASGAPDVTG